MPGLLCYMGLLKARLVLAHFRKVAGALPAMESCQPRIGGPWTMDCGLKNYSFWLARKSFCFSSRERLS